MLPARLRRMLLPALLALLGGCLSLQVGEQQQRLANRCELRGHVTAAADAAASPAIVVLVQRSGDAWQIADHFVMEQPGPWGFAVGSGHYGLIAFEDRNADRRYDVGDAWPPTSPLHQIACASGSRHAGINLALSSAELPPTVDLSGLRARSSTEQLPVTLGALTLLGEVTTLDDPRFDDSHTSDGLWRPVDFLLDAHPGIYFLEPYSAKRTPVLFVHGITGSPRNFRHFVEHLDRERFQPWLLYYPSGIHLGVVAQYLLQSLQKLQREYHPRRMLVVAHSMGGLVAREFILRNAETNGIDIPLFVSLASPWKGHQAADYGVKYAPHPIPVWEDMAPGSRFLRQLFFLDPDHQQQPRRLPEATRHHLLFAFKRKQNSFGASGDGTIVLASQLTREAQRDAHQLHGFDNTHMTILSDDHATALLNRLLAGADH
jgi:pimeloyl-ACP methyl ester carboxylesterase